MDQDAAKKTAAEAACRHVKDGTDIGLGTGSTAEFAVRRLGDMVREGLRIRGVPTSERTARLAREVGVPLVDAGEVGELDLTIDGADEVDPNLDLVKGLGGALLREKIVASITRRQVIVVDPTKLVPRLGTRSPLPVEVLPFGVRAVTRRLGEMGLEARLRMREGRPAVTDNGNHVLDVVFANGMDDPRRLEAEINNVPGVVENGLFLGMTWRVVVGEAGGKIREIPRP